MDANKDDTPALRGARASINANKDDTPALRGARASINANKLFQSYKRHHIKKLGSKALTNFKIDDVCQPLFGAKYRGCNSQDTINWKTGLQIINTDTQDKAGEHWVGLYITPKTVYVYDSFGRPTPKLLKILTKQAEQRAVNIQDSENDPEQFGLSEICGQLCISWLQVVKRLGIRQALKI